MSVQSIQDNGSVKGSLDLGDHVTVSRGGGSASITIRDYLLEESQYDSSEAPNERLAHVLQKASRLPIHLDLTSFVNGQTRSWNKSHPTAVATSGDGQATQCPEGTTFVAASGSVTNNFCIDNKATYMVGDQYPTWREAVDFCAAAGKVMLTYEQEKLGAKSTDSKVVRNSGRWEWVLKSNGDDSQGQVGGFFDSDYYRRDDGELLGRGDPVWRDDYVAIRCGKAESK